VLKASLLKGEAVVASIGAGYVVFVAFHKEDTIKDLEMMCDMLFTDKT
jgi:D-Tyr-tRNAtyr deacylase